LPEFAWESLSLNERLPTLPYVASIYQRADSKYLWIEYIDAAGERRQESTKLRHAFPGESRKARQLRDELTRREYAAQTAVDVNNGIEYWAAWVPRFLGQRYSSKTLTLRRALEAWHNLSAFLNEHAIAVPRQLARQHVRDFIEWRQDAHPECGTHKGGKNTALLEIKFLALIVDEALASGFCNSNPCHRLGMGRDEPHAKTRITDAEHRLITRSLKCEPEWMRVSYKIAWEQGCRFSETIIDLRDVDLARNVLRLRTKGKKERAAEVPLNRNLRPLFRRLAKSKRKFTFEKAVIPRGGAGKAWSNFFRKIGLGHICFHSTRVTFITRCYEAGIPEPDVMRLVLHASTTVHRIYPRLPAHSPHLQTTMQRLVKAERAA
jgi:integrase